MDTKVHKKGIWRKLVQNWRTSVLWFRPSWVKKCRVWRSPHFLSLWFLLPTFHSLSLSISFNDSDLSWEKEMCTFVLVTFIFEGWYKVYLELYCSPYFFYRSLCISFIDFFIQFTWSEEFCVNSHIIPVTDWHSILKLASSILKLASNLLSVSVNDESFFVPSSSFSFSYFSTISLSFFFL